MIDPLFIVVDLFCGAGGTTTGFVQAELEDIGIAKVIACVNHDPKAIQSHWRNHPDVKHFEEDIRTLDLTELVRLVKYYRNKYPNALVVLWGSLPCPHFSKARGGTPKDEEIRTLARSLYMKYNINSKKHYPGRSYIQELDPDYVMIENVSEFMSWGPLDAAGKPISKKNGNDFVAWKNAIIDLGYYDDWKHLNSADFGAYTSRNRLFGCFSKKHLPIVWPEPTHTKTPSKFSMHGVLQKWKPVKEVLDFSDEGASIFGRLKPLSDKTLERIYAGLIKYVANGETTFISKYFSGNPADKNQSINEPAGCITTVDHHSLIKTNFLTHYYSSGGQLSSIEQPAPTIPTKARTALIECQSFIMPTNFDNKPCSIDQPAPTITANRKHHYLVQAEGGVDAIAVYDADSEVMIRIKKFMAAYSIVDIKMRMLRVKELLTIQGFPADYQLLGNQADQKKFIGNSVVPLVVKKWTEALAHRITDSLIQKIA